MKLKALAALCMRKGEFWLTDGASGQWLGTSEAQYLLPGLPYLHEENLAGLFDITGKQAEKIIFRHQPLLGKYNFGDADEGETLLDRGHMTLGCDGGTFRPLITSTGLELIDERLFAPLADAAYLELYERRDGDGDAYFAVKSGMLVAAVFLPVRRVAGKLTTENLEALASAARMSLGRGRWE